MPITAFFSLLYLLLTKALPIPTHAFASYHDVAGDSDEAVYFIEVLGRAQLEKNSGACEPKCLGKIKSLPWKHCLGDWSRAMSQLAGGGSFLAVSSTVTVHKERAHVHGAKEVDGFDAMIKCQTSISHFLTECRWCFEEFEAVKNVKLLENIDGVQFLDFLPEPVAWSFNNTHTLISPTPPPQHNPLNPQLAPSNLDKKFPPKSINAKLASSNLDKKFPANINANLEVDKNQATNVGTAPMSSTKAHSNLVRKTTPPPLAKTSLSSTPVNNAAIIQNKRLVSNHNVSSAESNKLTQRVANRQSTAYHVEKGGAPTQNKKAAAQIAKLATNTSTKSLSDRLKSKLDAVREKLKLGNAKMRAKQVITRPHIPTPKFTQKKQLESSSSPPQKPSRTIKDSSPPALADIPMEDAKPPPLSKHNHNNKKASAVSTSTIPRSGSGTGAAMSGTGANATSSDTASNDATPTTSSRTKLKSSNKGIINGGSAMKRPEFFSDFADGIHKETARYSYGKQSGLDYVTKRDADDDDDPFGDNEDTGDDDGYDD